MSTLLSEPRTSTVRTTKESRFIVVGPGQVRAFFSYSTPLALKLATILAKRLKETTRDLYQARRALEERQAPSPSGQMRVGLEYPGLKSQPGKPSSARMSLS